MSEPIDPVESLDIIVNRVPRIDRHPTNSPIRLNRFDRPLSRSVNGYFQDPKFKRAYWEEMKLL